MASPLRKEYSASSDHLARMVVSACNVLSSAYLAAETRRVYQVSPREIEVWYHKNWFEM